MKIIRARVADHFAQIAQDEQDAEKNQQLVLEIAQSVSVPIISLKIVLPTTVLV